jgi:hypothetical protein
MISHFRLASKRCFPDTCHRYLNTHQARKALGLSLPSFSTQELRQAYFEAAKKCHPDAMQAHPHRLTDERKPPQDIAHQFRLVTQAYELLSNKVQDTNESGDLPHQQQVEFRSACQSILGVDAEIVEECKRDPKFRQWLKGNTDAAIYWRNFFAVHGGLAPMLEIHMGYLESSSTTSARSTTRRKRVVKR